MPFKFWIKLRWQMSCFKPTAKRKRRGNVIGTFCCHLCKNWQKWSQLFQIKRTMTMFAEIAVAHFSSVCAMGARFVSRQIRWRCLETDASNLFRHHLKWPSWHLSWEKTLHVKARVTILTFELLPLTLRIGRNSEKKSPLWPLLLHQSLVAKTSNLTVEDHTEGEPCFRGNLTNTNGGLMNIFHLPLWLWLWAKASSKQMIARPLKY